jgi:MoxR-like ATPase
MTGNPPSPLSREERERIVSLASSLSDLRKELRRRIVGQEEVITQVLAAILAEGHCLIVGFPGLAKTLLVSSIAELLSVDFKRIQFTPDLMPSDITGTTMISDGRSTGDGGGREFRFLRGPVFTNILLADEINRTPPKTQASLMEAMEERQVSAAGQRLLLDRPFFVLATENPIEQEGTYPLPVSQLDRFLFNITIDYPTDEEEFRIVMLTTSTYTSRLDSVFSREQVLEMIRLVQRIEVEPRLIDYAARIVRSTRPSAKEAPPLTREFVAWGAGPRAAQALILSAKAVALMSGRHAVTSDDIHQVAIPTLRHRIILRYHAQAEGIQPDEIVDRVLTQLPDGLYKGREKPGVTSLTREGKRTENLGRGLSGLFSKLRGKK